MLEIKLIQFTRFYEEHYPKFNTSEYIINKTVETGLSTDICSYCYVKETDIGNGITRREFVKKTEALKLMEENNESINSL